MSQEKWIKELDSWMQAVNFNLPCSKKQFENLQAQREKTIKALSEFVACKHPPMTEEQLQQTIDRG